MISFLTNDITEYIIDLAKRSKSLKATTAFWTIGLDFFKTTHLVKLLGDDNSYFVTDISEPTIIENVVKYAEAGANMRFYMKRAKDNLLKYDHLLHSKLFLFEHLYGDDYTLIIGSANMTSRALKGINKEAGVAITLNKSDVLLSEVLDYLKNIIRDSIPVDPNKIEIYKFIQDQGNLDSFFNSCPLLYLVSKTTEYNQANDSMIIQLLGMNDDTYKFFDKIQSLNSKLALIIENHDTGESKVCVCSIKSTGEIKIDNKETYEKNYQSRLFFYIGLTDFSGASTPAYLHPSTKILQQMFFVSDFHAELQIVNTYNFAYENDGSLKKKLYPWKEVEVIEGERTEIPDKFNFDQNIKRFGQNEKVKINRIRIEEIRKDFISDDILKKISEIISRKNFLLDKVDPIPVDNAYLNANNDVITLISEVSFSKKERDSARKSINHLLSNQYYQRKQDRTAPRQNIRLFEPHLVFKFDQKKL